MTLLIVLALVGLALTGMPLYVVLAGGAWLAYGAAELDPSLIMVEIQRLAASPNLIAIPLFTLAGVTLARGGAAERLIRLFNAMLGWLPGGVAIVALVVCAFFTAFSGASGVTILALGGLLYPMLCGAGYPKQHAMGLVTASGSIGLLVPPSLPVLLYGIVAGVSIDALFLAGLVPGLLLLGLFALLSMSVSLNTDAPRPPFQWPALLAALRAGMWDLGLPIGLLLGIFSGVVTVSEAAACTAAYALLLEAGIHRRIRLLDRSFIAILQETAVLVGSILIILAVAVALTNLLVDNQVPTRVFEWLSPRLSSPLEFLLWLNLFLLLVGCVLEVFSAIVVVVPLILPLAARYGVDPVHLGIIFLANLEIGYLTPPVGFNQFIAHQSLGQPLGTLFRATAPFFGLMLLWLLLITYWPATTLWWRD